MAVPNLVGEIQGAASAVRSYLAKEIKKLISIREFNAQVTGNSGAP